MPGNNIVLHRLDSYQTGGGSSGVGATQPGDENNDDIDNGRNNDTDTLRPSLLAQFSLIGDADDNTGDDIGLSLHRCFYWCRKLGIAIWILFAIIMAMHANTTSMADAPTPSSSEQIMSCPIKSSYSVTSDVMELKNSSTVENMQNGVVATDHPICSQVGVNILQIGNAADAAIASALCLGVVNPTSSGIGGGAFILIHSDAKEAKGDGSESPLFEDARSQQSRMKDRIMTARNNPESNSSDKAKQYTSSQKRRVTEFIDCRETAPRRSTFDMFEKLPVEASTLGGLSVAIPGELRGLELLHHRHGSLDWEKLVRPSFILARDGFIVGPHLAKAIKEKEKYIRTMPNMGHILTKNNDGVTLLKEGDIMIRSQYAKTLEAIMSGGSDALYKEDLAGMLAKDIQDAGGIITIEDISEYRPVLRDPLISQVAGYNIIGAPPPSSGGGAIIGALRFLAGFALPYSALLDTLSAHWYVEACRHVFAMRMSLSDPKFSPDENANVTKDLLEGYYMEMLRQNTLDNSILNLSQYGGHQWAQLNDTDDTGALVDAQEGDRKRRKRQLRLFNYLEDSGTSSLSVVDKDRNTVTITSSINLEFGSKVVSPSTGIILNNQMDDFATPGRTNFFGLNPAESNYIIPGKRALSSMSPTMVFKGSNTNDDDTTKLTGTDNLGTLVLSLGASGGPKIITTVLQTILNHLFVGMPLFQAMAAPRIHNQLIYHNAAATNTESAVLPQGPMTEVSERTRLALKKRGHQLVPSNYLGAVQAVSQDEETNLLTAVSDIRKQGLPAGY